MTAEERMKQAGKAHDGPEATMIRELGDAFASSVGKLEENIAKMKDASDATKLEFVNEIEKLRTESMAAMQDLADRHTVLSKRQTILSPGLTGAEKCTKLIDAIPEKKRHLISFAEQTMGRSFDPMNTNPISEKGYMTDPIFKTASALWFSESAKMQLPGKFKDATGSRQTVESLERAFENAFGKAIDEMTEGSSPAGGYLVPAPIAAEILRLIEDNGVMRPLVRKIPMTSKTLALPQKGNAITAYIGAEQGTLTGSVDETALAQATLTAKRFHGRATFSIELLEDAIVGLMPYIQTCLGEEIAILEDQEALEGDGTNFTGIIAATGVNSVATTTTNGEAIVYQDLVDTVFKARQRSSRKNARWFMAPEQMAKVVGLVDSNGMPVFQFAHVPNAIIPSILGFPVEMISTISITITRGSSGGTSNIYFGPPQAVVFGDRAGLRWDVSDAPNWGTYQMDARLVKRTGIVTGIPTALTKLVGGIV